MGFQNVLKFLIPKEKKFFPLFEQSTQYMVDSAMKLEELVKDKGTVNRQKLIAEIEALENKADLVTHELILELGKTFITPFDREDIQTLTTALDDVIDYINSAAKRIGIYKVTEFSPAMIQLAEYITQSARVLDDAMPELRTMKNRAKLKQACVDLNDIENLSDHVFEMAIAELFEEGEFKTREILKIKEILAVMEEATDRAEHASYVIESILIKTS